MKIFECRKNTGLTQYQVAKDLNITRATYANYEAGNTEPNIETLICIANYFGVSLDYLCEHPYRNEYGYLTEVQKRCMDLLKQLDSDTIEKAEAYLTARVEAQKEKELEQMQQYKNLKRGN